MMSEDMQTEAPRRGRPPRVQAEEGRRRRRKGVLDVMQHSRLSFADDMLDHDNWVYRWINDEHGRLRHLTRQDDYDYVTAADLGEDYDPSMTDSESDERIRMIVGTSGNQPLYAYLCKKPRSFWESDNAEMVAYRESVMEGRVYQAQLEHENDKVPGGADNFYAPKENYLSPGVRRRGPVTRSLK